MTKKIIVAVALAAAVAAVAAPSFAEMFHNHRMEPAQGNTVCFFCKGSGRSGSPQAPTPFKCQYCNGTGFQGSY